MNASRFSRTVCATGIITIFLHDLIAWQTRTTAAIGNTLYLEIWVCTTNSHGWLNYPQPSPVLVECLNKTHQRSYQLVMKLPCTRLFFSNVLKTIEQHFMNVIKVKNGTFFRYSENNVLEKYHNFLNIYKCFRNSSVLYYKSAYKCSLTN